MNTDQELTAPFFLPGKGERAAIKIMLVHGFTGSPQEFRLLGGFLNECGYTVNAVRLPGHGTCISDMAKTRWPDWWQHLIRSYDELNTDDTRKIIAIGHSMGGLLSLKLSTVKKLDGAVSLATPIFIQKRSALAELLGQLLRRPPVPSVPAGDSVFYYDKPPLRCLFSLWSLLNHVKRSLPQIKTPIFVSQGQRDLVVQPRSADYIYSKASSALKKIRYYPKSSHGILLDSEREEVHSDISRFLHLITS